MRGKATAAGILHGFFEIEVEPSGQGAHHWPTPANCTKACRVLHNDSKVHNHTEKVFPPDSSGFDKASFRPKSAAYPQSLAVSRIMARKQNICFSRNSH
jgi:hypothetical protein